MHMEMMKKIVMTRTRIAGAHDLLVRLRENGCELAVATSASNKDLEALLKQAGLDDVIEKAHADAADALMLGDTPYDVGAATRAGVEVVAVRCGGGEDEELKGAIAIYDDPSDLLRHYSAPPFGKK
jgi:phosphoglycolate phosphatase-like HAD superfamily hydrolase